MSVSKITTTVSPTEQTQKINEIIENIPTVNNSTITFTQGGVTKGTITTNQNSNSSIELDAGGSGSSRNIGEIITSTIPLSDSGLHLLDGAVLSGDGIYADFVDYIADLYNTSDKNLNVNIINTLTNTNNILSGFSSDNYAQIPYTFHPLTNNWEVCLKFNSGNRASVPILTIGNSTAYRLEFRMASYKFRLLLVDHNGTGENVAGTLTISADTDYYIKINYSNSLYTLSYSTDGTTYTQDIAVTYNHTLLEDVLFGGDLTGSSWTGGNYSIDFNSAYIDINGSRWWQGVQPSWAISETQWQTSVTNYGSCDKYVYDSTNNTVRLPKRTTEHGALIKSYSSGTGWCRIYQDSWCEQGGTTTGSLSWGTTTVKLVKPYINTNYSIALAGSTTESGDFTSSGSTSIRGTTRGLYLNTNKTTNKFVIQSNNDVSWYTCGYANVATYQYNAIYEYVVLATSTKTEIEVDIDEIATDLNGKADVDLSNVSTSLSTIPPTSLKNFDGQWVSSVQTLSTATAIGTYTIDLSSYLPNDNYNYDVMFHAHLYSTSSTSTNVLLTTSIFYPREETDVENFMLTNGSSKSCHQTVVLPILSSSRTLTLKIKDNKPTTCFLSVRGYRRIGTNI